MQNKCTRVLAFCVEAWTKPGRALLEQCRLSRHDGSELVSATKTQRRDEGNLWVLPVLHSVRLEPYDSDLMVIFVH